MTSEPVSSVLYIRSLQDRKKPIADGRAMSVASSVLLGRLRGWRSYERVGSTDCPLSRLASVLVSMSCVVVPPMYLSPRLRQTRILVLHAEYRSKGPTGGHLIIVQGTRRRARAHRIGDQVMLRCRHECRLCPGTGLQESPYTHFPGLCH